MSNRAKFSSPATRRRVGGAVLILILLGADLGCSQFRARRRATGSASTPLGSAAPLGTEVAPETLSTVPATGTTTAPVLVEPAESPSSGAGLAPMPEPAAFPGTANNPDISLRPPVPAGPDGVSPASTSALHVAITPADRSTSVARLVADARTALDGLSSYQLALRRQERVGGALMPAEDLAMSIRRSPQAVRLTWTDGPHRGREVLYRADEPGQLMHVNMADSKLPLPRMNLAPDSPLVMKNSRHPITEAGLDPVVASLEAAQQAGTLTALPPISIAPFALPLPGLVRKTRDGDIWRAYLDPTTHLPAFVECRASNGDLVESYLFANVQANPAELTLASAFDPDLRWGAPRGLFGRATARAGGPDPASLR